MNLFKKQKQIYRLREQIYSCWWEGGRSGEGIVREFETEM